MDGLLKKYRISPKIIGISPGTAESAKCRMWPYEKYAEACNSVIEKYNATVMFVGTEEERRLADEIIKNTKLDTATINSTLSILEIKGVISSAEFGYKLI